MFPSLKFRSFSLRYSLVLIAFLLPIHLTATPPKDNEQSINYKNGIYLELGGKHVTYSLQYERQLYRKGLNQFGLRIGGSYYPNHLWGHLNEPVYYGFSISPNYLLGSKPNKFMLGVGYSLLYGRYDEARRAKVGKGGFPHHFFSGEIGYHHDFQKIPLYIQLTGVLMVKAFYFRTFHNQYHGSRAPDAVFPFFPTISLGFGYHF